MDRRDFFKTSAVAAASVVVSTEAKAKELTGFTIDTSNLLPFVSVYVADALTGAVLFDGQVIGHGDIEEYLAPVTVILRYPGLKPVRCNVDADTVLVMETDASYRSEG